MNEEININIKTDSQELIHKPTAKAFRGVVSSILLMLTLGYSAISNSSLVPRLGGLAYYDDVANLTWLANANVNGGPASWWAGNTWVANFSVAGVTGWRLPAGTMYSDSGCSGSAGKGFGCTLSEMASLFNVQNISAATPGPFSNLQAGSYWTATPYSSWTGAHAYYFDFDTGEQGIALRGGPWRSLWPVHTGDVAPVPVPAAVWLFGSGLIGLIGFARGRNRKQ